jgi:hypothetical protein
MRRLVLSLAQVAVWASQSGISRHRAGYVDLETGSVHPVSLVALNCARRDGDTGELADGDYDHLALAQSILSCPERYVEIPRLGYGLEEQQELLLRELRHWFHALGIDAVDKSGEHSPDEEE